MTLSSPHNFSWEPFSILGVIRVQNRAATFSNAWWSCLDMAFDLWICRGRRYFVQNTFHLQTMPFAGKLNLHFTNLIYLSRTSERNHISIDQHSVQTRRIGKNSWHNEGNGLFNMHDLRFPYLTHMSIFHHKPLEHIQKVGCLSKNYARCFT